MAISLMNLTQAGAELGFSEPELAKHLDTSVETLHSWDAGSATPSKSQSREITFLIASAEREVALRKVGLEPCQWLRAHDEAAGDLPPEAIQRHLKEVESHLRSCAVCRAREEYARKNLQPLPPRGPWWVRRLAFIARLPSWSHPVLLGALFLFGIVGVRMLFVLPLAIVHPRELPPMFLALGAATAAGGLGGLAYTILGRPAKRVPLVGPYLAGIVAVSGYCGALILVAPLAFKEPLLKEPSDWIIWGLMAVFFGTIFGHAAFRNKAPDRASTA
jgi:hypothetical protein